MTPARVSVVKGQPHVIRGCSRGLSELKQCVAEEDDIRKLSRLVSEINALLNVIEM
jgi:hypothetical protein